MSRKIQTNHATMNEDEQALRDTKAGKILFTKYREKKCAFYLHGNRLLAVQVMSETTGRIGSVHIGKIKNVVKNIDACFLEIAEKEICFLARRDAEHPILLNRKYDGRLLEGDELLVQITREAQKTKQASVTADISLSNEYAAISIGSTKVGYSGKLEKTRKEEIKSWLMEAGLLTGADFSYDFASDNLQTVITDTNFDETLSLGLVVRTKAGECSKEALVEQIKNLLNEFQELVHTAKHRTCFSCVKQAPEDFEIVLDQLAYPNEYDEIVTDDAAFYEKLCDYAKEKLPDKKVRLYRDEQFSLSKLYSLEQKMDTALNKRVWLKSGGYLIIEHTEALTVIDVNTGKYEPQKASRNINCADTFELINREAAEEVALQLRLRNLSGIIVVDFINMQSKEREEELLEYLRTLVRRDKIKTGVVDMTGLGLVEITRKKRNKPLREQMI